VPREWRGSPGRQNVAHDFFRGVYCALDFADDDAGTGRLDRDGNARRSRPLLAGDTTEVAVEGIGVLSNPVHPAQA